MMVMIESCLAGAKARRAGALQAALTALLAAHGGDDVLAAAGSDRLLRAVRVGVGGTQHDLQGARGGARRAHLRRAGRGLGRGPRAGDDAARARVCGSRACAAPRGVGQTRRPGAAPVVPGLLPPVQKAAMGLLAASPPEPARAPRSGAAYLDTLVALLSPQQLLQQAVAERGSAAAPPNGAQGPRRPRTPHLLGHAHGAGRQAAAGPLAHLSPPDARALVQAFENAPSALESQRV